MEFLFKTLFDQLFLLGAPIISDPACFRDLGLSRDELFAPSHVGFKLRFLGRS